MELELGLGLALALPSHYVPFKSSGHLNGNNIIDSTTNFDDNFSEIMKKNPNFSMPCPHHDIKTLPLLIWNGQPNEEDDDDDHQKRTTTFEPCYRETKEEKGVVGWPPIKSWRKKVLLNVHEGGGWNTNNNNNDIEGHVGGIRNSMYVKVKMEGVAIGRKIDLSLYNSYQLLTNTLLQMFPKSDESGEEKDGGFTLLYQDKEGDWMLAGDVPWETFMETAQRIQILRNWKRGTSRRKSTQIS